MQVKAIKRFELVELQVNANTPGQFNFDTQANLRNQPDQIIYIQGIQVYPNTVYSNSQTSSAIPGVAVTEIPKAVLVLYVNDELSVYRIPLAQLINVQDNNNPSLFQQEIQTFENLGNVAWDKSFVQFSVAPVGATYIIPFGITYIKMKRDPANPQAWIPA